MAGKSEVGLDGVLNIGKKVMLEIDKKAAQQDKAEEIKEGMLESYEGDNEWSDEDILAEYINEEDNYVLDGAIIKCSKMSDKTVKIEHYIEKTIIRGEGGEASKETGEKKELPVAIEVPRLGLYEANPDREESRKLFAVHATEQNDNGIRFATVSDCACLRDVEKKEKEGEEPAGKASIISFGNCKIVRAGDIDEIEKEENKEGVKKYGTCYCLMKLEAEWDNPLCTESVAGKCYAEESALPRAGIAAELSHPSSHHRTMKWGTEDGEKEGLTLLSTLLCTRGGVISIETSGQVFSWGDDILEKMEWAKIEKDLDFVWWKDGLLSTEHATIEFVKKTIEIANELQMNPDDLFAVMAFESWFDPKAKNPVSTATGLIQFMEVTAKSLNTSTEELANMSNIDQLDYVYKYYEPYTGKINDIYDAYMVTFCPKGVGKTNDYVLYEDGQKGYTKNARLDYNGDGKITKEEAVREVLERRKLYEKGKN